MLLQPAIIIKPMMAINTMMQTPKVRSHKLSTLAIGMTQAAPMTLVITVMTVSNECSEKSLVIYAERFAVKLLFNPLTKYRSHMLYTVQQSLGRNTNQATHEA